MPSSALVITLIALSAAVILFKKSVYDPCAFPSFSLYPVQRLLTSHQFQRLNRRADFCACTALRSEQGANLSEKAGFF